MAVLILLSVFATVTTTVAFELAVVNSKYVNDIKEIKEFLLISEDFLKKLSAQQDLIIACLADSSNILLQGIDNINALNLALLDYINTVERVLIINYDDMAKFNYGILWRTLINTVFNTLKTKNNELMGFNLADYKEIMLINLEVIIKQSPLFEILLNISKDYQHNGASNSVIFNYFLKYINNEEFRTYIIEQPVSEVLKHTSAFFENQIDPNSYQQIALKDSTNVKYQVFITILRSLLKSVNLEVSSFDSPNNQIVSNILNSNSEFRISPLYKDILF